jgi:sugar fermentation stimulation protein A
MELKSAVYLDSDGAAMYPDVISLRGREHIELLGRLPHDLRRVITFIAAHPAAKYFRPCSEADPLIGKLLKEAVEKGVEVKAVKISLEEGVAYLEDDSLPIHL